MQCEYLHTHITTYKIIRLLSILPSINYQIKIMIDAMEHLDQKRKNEKKELQAQIMALKKMIKGDKSKKKECTAEIVRLEMELEEKHKNQMEQLQEAQQNNEEDEEQDILVEKLNSSKISKAQKRRDKKALEDRERNERIKQQEKENLHGPRLLETQEIKSKLKDANLLLHIIPSDGDCLYNAISHQLGETGRKVLHVTELRKAASNYIRDNKDIFMPFMSNPETCEMLTDDQFQEYCNEIANTKTWGGQIEIRALSNVLHCPIYVIQGEGQDTVKQGEEIQERPLIITYHRHMYSLGEHYNSVISIAAAS